MKWRKLIALFSVLLMGFSVFAGCDNGENQPKDTYYTITFALNGGEISGKDVSDGIQIKSGSTFDLSGYQPVRPGFAFQGWKSGSTDYAWDAKIPMNSDITLTAQWQANSYTLTLELNGGSLADGEDSFTLTHGQTFDLSALTAERGGFRLTGWKSGETAYLPDETITVTGNMTLTAQWTLDSSPADMFVFDELEDGSVALAGLAEGVTPESIVLSAAYGDKKITEIKDSAFKDVDSLKYVYLDGATELQKIGDDAFANCSNLEIVSLKGLAKLETLGESVFEGAYSYSETIPNSLKVVDFSGCTALKSIGNYAFRYQRTLGKVDLSVCRNLTTIGKEGFAYCEALETLSLPVSLGEISADFFTGCNSLQRVDVAEGNIFLYSEAGVLYDADQTELIRFPAKSKITEYVVPETVTSIRAGAFAGADLLEKIVLPASVSIKTSTVFADCSSLQEIKFGADPSDNLVIDGVLYNAEGTQLLRYPAGKIDAEFSIPETVLVVADGAFLNAVHLRTLKIPKNVISFGDKLKGCSSLERVEVDEGNTAYSSLDGIFYNKAQTKLLRYPILWKGTGESYTAPATLTETFAEYAFQGGGVSEVIGSVPVEPDNGFKSS